MSAAVKITRTDRTTEELRGLAAKSNDGSQVRWFLALTLILEGHARASAASLSGMDRQTLRDWVHRYNEQSVAGLRSTRSGGHPATLTPEQMAEPKALTIAGPDPEIAKVVRWRCVDLREEVARRFSVTVTEGTIGKWLRKMNLTRLQPRPFHPKKDAAAEEAFKKLRQPGESRAARQHGHRRPERHACRCSGAGRFMSTDGTRQPA